MYNIIVDYLIGFPNILQSGNGKAMSNCCYCNRDKIDTTICYFSYKIYKIYWSTICNNCVFEMTGYRCSGWLGIVNRDHLTKKRLITPLLWMGLSNFTKFERFNS